MSDEIIDNKSESSEQHLKGLNIHSEQVQDIMGRPPGWLVRCGISIILLVIVLLLVGSAFVKYPEVLTAAIKINAYNLPAQVKARSTGRIDTLFVREGDTVNAGQNVNIKLDDYPYMEFGFVQVGLSKMSLMPYEDASAGNIYVMEVELPDSLVTQYGKVIPYRPEMSGTAEIITEDMSVLVRLINPIRAVLRR